MKYRLAGIRRTALLAVLALAWLLPANSIAAEGLVQPASTPSSASAAATPAWLEPNGLNIVDLVGFVPDEYLRGAIVSWATGIVQYDSGTRNGDQVTLHVRISPRIFLYSSGENSVFECLGQRPYADGWASVAPASQMKLYANGTDITSRMGMLQYVQGGLIQPTHNASGDAYSRYPTGSQKLTMSSGWAAIPSNRGCVLYVPGRYDALTADFVVQAQPDVIIGTLGQEHFQFSSYIGPGNLGCFQAVVDQLRAAGWEDRHDKLPLNIPPAANYLFVNYPPMPVDAYTSCGAKDGTADLNIVRPSGGTYRIGNNRGQLSVDIHSTMGLPIGGQWQDVDQVGGTAYLPYFSDGNILAAPEYVVPAGIPFQPCLRDGNCPTENSIIDKIGHAKMPLTVTYLAVTRSSTGLQRVPLRQVGSRWSPGVALAAAATEIQKLAASIDLKFHVFLAIVRVPDDPTGCPCGWFTGDGRMVNFTAGR